MQLGRLRRFVVTTAVSLATAYVLVTVYLMFLAPDDTVEVAFERSPTIVGALALVFWWPIYWLLAKGDSEKKVIAFGRKALLGSIVTVVLIGLVIGVLAFGGYLSGTV